MIRALSRTNAQWGYSSNFHSCDRNKWTVGRHNENNTMKVPLQIFVLSSMIFVNSICDTISESSLGYV
jgi:hypothetical protein